MGRLVSGPTAAVLLDLESNLKTINDYPLIVKKKKRIWSCFNSVILGANRSVNWEEFTVRGALFTSLSPLWWRNVTEMIHLALFHNIIIFCHACASKFSKSFFSDCYFYLLIFRINTENHLVIERQRMPETSTLNVKYTWCATASGMSFCPHCRPECQFMGERLFGNCWL